MTELVRYDLSHISDDCHCKPGGCISENKGGKYVTYSQAAEIIAAKDKEIDKLKRNLEAREAQIIFLEHRWKEGKAAESERDHWKANHDNMVQRNAVLSQRPDLPVDRLPAIREYERMLAEKDVEKQQMLNAMDSMTKAFKRLEVKLANYELQFVRCDCLLL